VSSRASTGSSPSTARATVLCVAWVSRA
jgi:hypothetical protein